MPSPAATPSTSATEEAATVLAEEKENPTTIHEHTHMSFIQDRKSQLSTALARYPLLLSVI